MEFIKRNYEKIILSLVLLGLVGVLVAMWFVITADQQQMADMRDHVTHPKSVSLPDLDLSRQQAVMSRLQSSNNLDLSTTNKVFNPVSWQRTADGRLMRASKTGPDAAVVTKITPLYFSIALDSVITNALGNPPRYVFSVTDETAAHPGQRHARHQYASKGDTVTDKSLGRNEGFTLKEVKGPPENPDQLVLTLPDAQAAATLSKDKLFRRVDAYSADLKYDFDKPPYVGTGLRVGDHMAFGGDNYNVIDIQSNTMILLAQSNQKKFTLPYTP